MKPRCGETLRLRLRERKRSEADVERAENVSAQTSDRASASQVKRLLRRPKPPLPAEILAPPKKSSKPSRPQYAKHSSNLSTISTSTQSRDHSSSRWPQKSSLSSQQINQKAPRPSPQSKNTGSHSHLPSSSTHRNTPPQSPA